MYNLTSSIPLMGREALALVLDKIIESLSAASCIEARINSAERMLQKQYHMLLNIHCGTSLPTFLEQK